jgi:hypothetical protein
MENPQIDTPSSLTAFSIGRASLQADKAVPLVPKILERGRHLEAMGSERIGSAAVLNLNTNRGLLPNI